MVCPNQSHVEAWAPVQQCWEAGPIARHLYLCEWMNVFLMCVLAFRRTELPIGEVWPPSVFAYASLSFYTPCAPQMHRAAGGPHQKPNRCKHLILDFKPPEL